MRSRSASPGHFCRPDSRRNGRSRIPAGGKSIGAAADGGGAMSKHVAVLMGGWSAEREVSLRSGAACADALVRLGYRVTRIDVGRDIATVLTAAKPDVALNVLHGRPGEDGTLQGMLEILAIPYTHSGVHGVRGRHAEGRRQGPVPRRRRAGPRRRGGLPLRGGQSPPAAAALRDQADRGGLERRGFHRHARIMPIRRRSSPARTGPTASGSSSKATSPARS